MDNKLPFLLPPSSSSEAADYEPLAKKPRELLFGKLCIICHCMSEDSDDDFYIFIVDLEEDSAGGNSNEFIPRTPTLRIGCSYDFEVTAFCVLRSTLYLFAAEMKVADDGKIDPLQRVEVTSVYTFELSPDVLTYFNFKLEKSMLRQTPHMLQPKASPLATPTPDGKILVFSSVIWVPRPGDRVTTLADTIDFELYDPSKEKWSRLPGIIDDWGPDRVFLGFYINIRAYTFYRMSTLLLQTDIGMFALDLASLDSGGVWKTLNRFRGAPSIPYVDGFSGAIGDDLYLTPYCAYDIGKEDDGFTRIFNFPGLSPLGFDYTSGSFAMALLNEDVNGGKCCFCILQAGIKHETMNPHMIIHIYCCDLIKYRDILIKYREEDEMKMRDERKMRDKGKIGDERNMRDERKMRDPALPGTTPWLLKPLLSLGKKFESGNTKHAFAIEYTEPLVHSALSLWAYSEHKDLKFAKEKFLQGTVYVHKETKIYLPKVLCYYAKDLSLGMASILEVDLSERV